MGNLTFSEIIWILIVILIVFGPQRLPEMARKVGQFVAKARDAATALQRQLTDEYGDAIAPLQDVSNELKEARRAFTDTARAAVRNVEEGARTLQGPIDGSSDPAGAEPDAADATEAGRRETSAPPPGAPGEGGAGAGEAAT